MPRGQSTASKEAWERNWKFGQVCYALGMLRTLASTGVLSQSECNQACDALATAKLRHKPKSHGITTE